MVCYPVYDRPGVYLKHKETPAATKIKETKMGHWKNLGSNDKKIFLLM